MARSTRSAVVLMILFVMKGMASLRILLDSLSYLASSMVCPVALFINEIIFLPELPLILACCSVSLSSLPSISKWSVGALFF